ncbi:MAG TPA: ABC transporter substrate-binding protein [Candidatus Binatia bacterium]|jgi:ABC-type nitrate/sulfonate/bicarbonate transport system substrate-binding protein
MMDLKKLLQVSALVLVLPTFAAAQDEVKFPAAASSKVLGYAPLWVASGMGFLKQQGLDSEVTAIRGTAPTMQALVSDSIYVALAANDGVIGLVEKGIDVAMIAAGSKSTHMIMGGKGFKTYEDLRGATLGSSTLTSGTAFLLKRVLKAHGLEYPRDYKLINVGGSGPAFTALSTGAIAAAILAVPINFRAQEMGFNLIGKVTDVFPNYLLSSFSVRREFAAAHRGEVVRFLKAVLQARRWLEENRKAGAEFLAKELEIKPKLAEKGLDYYLTHQAWEPDLSIDMSGLKTVIDVYAEQADLKGPIPSPEKYVDLSYLQLAWKELGWR